MKVILLQDVAKVGRRFEVADVPTGYALNKLIPSGMAEAATKESLKRMKSQADKAASDRASNSERFAEALTALKGTKVSVSVQANEKGHLFEALKPTAIIEAVAKTGLVLTEKQMHIDVPIKEVGEYTVVLHEGDIKGEMLIEVVAS